jgi:hypothetical protein
MGERPNLSAARKRGAGQERVRHRDPLGRQRRARVGADRQRMCLGDFGLRRRNLSPLAGGGVPRRPREREEELVTALRWPRNRSSLKLMVQARPFSQPGRDEMRSSRQLLPRSSLPCRHVHILRIIRAVEGHSSSSSDLCDANGSVKPKIAPPSGFDSAHILP